MTESNGPPDPATCAARDDVGRLHHNRSQDIWYECIFDSRRDIVTWAIIPVPDD